ncbi:alpha/beta fold hydrolase [Sinomonas mesophila]|uniref:alpha/beta fold hydrolase n=1 Tax=Sinomonas mesophila TaxID=1531955 RepID=UPI0009847CCB|nr:alpha/beta hydrolase [Sinomonas mesophila]
MGGEPALVLVHSPLVGASVWEPVASVLRLQGKETVVPSLADVFAGPAPYYPRLAAAVADAIDPDKHNGDSRVVLVGHSGAGALLPSVADATTTAVVGMVFVDALLPHPGRSWFSTVPEDMRGQMRGLARDGLLPPWNEWFPPGVLEHLLPDPGLRARFSAELPRLPVAYFDEPAPAVPDPAPSQSAYLRLAYTAQAEDAERAGWHVTSRSSHHLAMLTEPHEIGAALGHLIDALAP